MRLVDESTTEAVHLRLQELEVEQEGANGPLTALRLAQERLHLSVEVELAELRIAVAAAQGASRRRRINDSYVARASCGLPALPDEPPEISVM